jgi:cytochrome c oxidase cbb3-type subunit III
MRIAAALLAAGAFALLLASCEREEREPRGETAPAPDPNPVSLTTLYPGTPNPPPTPEAVRRYERNAYHISEGRRLYVWFNCIGCHANGGGGMGPALMDDTWIYGGEIQNIAATIVQGRPNGMPSFRDRIPEEQIWQIAAYVRSMGRSVPQAAAPARQDDMHFGRGEARRPYREPGPPGGGVPSSAARPQ